MALGPFYVAEKLMAAGDGVHGIALLMRHGETTWNSEGRVMGRNPVELSEHGRAQVTATAAMARVIKPEVIVTSPLVRARQSAELIAAGVGGNLEIIEDPQIAEVLYGHWEGMQYEDLIRDEYYKRYREAPLDHPTPGGETLYEVQARGVAAVSHAFRARPGARVLFVSHGDIIRTVLCHFMALELKHFRRIRVDNATLSAVEVAASFAEVKFMNLLADPGRAFVSPFATGKSKQSSQK